MRDNVQHSYTAPSHRGAGDLRGSVEAVDVSPEPVRQPLHSLEMSVRSSNALRQAGITTVEELCCLTVADLIRIRNIGNTSVADIKLALARVGLCLVDGTLSEHARVHTPDNVSASASACTHVASAQRASAQLLTAPLADLGLSARSSNALRRAGIKTTGQLCQLTQADVLHLRNIGKTSVVDVQRALRRVGLSLSAAPTITETVEIVEPAENADNKESHSSIPASLDEWAEYCFAPLDKRSRQVLWLRNGLAGQGQQTLGHVGSEIGVTRERIRQIEKRAMLRLRHHTNRRRLDVLSKHYAALIAARGGVMLESELADEIGRLLPNERIDPLTFSHFVLPLCMDVVNWGEERWASPDMDRRRYKVVEKAFVELLCRLGVPHPQQQLPELILRDVQLAALDRTFLAVCLRTSSALVIRNGWCFLPEWMQRYKAAWVVAALSQIGRPAHFTRVAATLHELASELAEVSDHSVHAILLRLPEVTRTGVGTYALNVWELGTEEDISDPPVRESTGVPDDLDPVEHIMRMIFPSGRN